MKTVDDSAYCSKCKVIARKDVETEHCTFCDYCVEKLDHHCPWSSKCIGRGNECFFKVFLAFLTACLVFAFVGGALVLGSVFKHSKVHAS